MNKEKALKNQGLEFREDIYFMGGGKQMFAFHKKPPIFCFYLPLLPFAEFWHSPQYEPDFPERVPPSWISFPCPRG